MTTYNTGNPVPSADARDRYDNSQTLDEVVNGDSESYSSRTGKQVISLGGMNSRFNNAQDARESAFNLSQEEKKEAFQSFLDGSGWYSLGAYSAGVVITSHTQTIDYQGQPYQLKPSIPASLDAPYITTGVWATEGVNFKLVGDNSLRQDLADPAVGAGIVGLGREPLTSEIKTVEGALSGVRLNIWEHASRATGYSIGGDINTWDWWPAIDFAGKLVESLGGGELYFPPIAKGYRVLAPIFQRSNVVYIGDSTLIYNGRPTSAIFGDQMVFLPGAFANDFYNALTYNSLSDIVAGERTVTLTNPADAERYSVGDTVILRDTASIVPTAVTPSVYMRFNIVKSKSGSVLTLKHPHDTSFSAVSLSRTDGETNFYPLPGIPQQKCYVAVKSGIKGLRIDTAGFWTGATAALECFAEDIEIISSRVLVYGNSYQRCDFNRISGNFQRILYEIASNSFMTTIRNLKANRIPGDTNETNIAIVNEGSESVHVSDVECNMNSAVSTAQLASFWQTKDCSLKRATFFCAGWRGSLIAANLTSGLCQNALVEDVTFHAGPKAAYGIDLIGAGFVKDFDVNRVTFYGASFVGGAGRLSATGCRIRNVKMQASTPFQIQPSAEDNRIEYNDIPGGFIATSGVLQEIIAKNNFSGNRTARLDNIKKSRYFLPSQLAITTQVPNTVAVSRPLKAPSFSNTIVSTLRINVRGNATGVTGTKDVLIRIAGTVVAAISFIAAESGRFSITVDLKANQSGGSCYCTIDKNGTVTTSRTTLSGLDFSTIDYKIALETWVGATGNGVTVDDFEILAPSII